MSAFHVAVRWLARGPVLRTALWASLLLTIGCSTFESRVLTVPEFVQEHAGRGADPVVVRGEVGAVLSDQMFELVGGDAKIPVLYRSGSLSSIARAHRTVVVSGEAMLLRVDSAHPPYVAPGVYANVVRTAGSPGRKAM